MNRNIDPRLATVRCCATCRHFVGSDLQIYRKGICTVDSGRYDGKTESVWTGSLCYKYVGREVR